MKIQGKITIEALPGELRSMRELLDWLFVYEHGSIRFQGVAEDFDGKRYAGAIHVDAVDYEAKPLQFSASVGGELRDLRVVAASGPPARFLITLGPEAEPGSRRRWNMPSFSERDQVEEVMGWMRPFRERANQDVMGGSDDDEE